MKILINSSSTHVGGGVQVGLNLVIQTLNTLQIHSFKQEFLFVVSSEIFEQLPVKFKSREDIFVYDFFPNSIMNIYSGNKFFQKLIRTKKIDIVYSVGAPSYLFLKVKEVLRLTNPWVIGGETLPYYAYPFFKSLLLRLRVFVKRCFIQRNCFIITQTNTAKKNIHKTLKIPNSKIFVISNIHSSIFQNDVKHAKRDGNIINIFVFAAPHVHKNLSIVPDVAKHLLDMGVNNFKFKVTIPKNLINNQVRLFYAKVKKLNISDHIENLGKIKLSDAPYLYQSSDILFLPTLLEVFSVTYLEAMESNTPIVTSNLPFARDVCENAAMYYDPKSSMDAAKKIRKLIEDIDFRDSLIENGSKRLDKFPMQEEIYGQHIKVVEQVYLN